ncbi:MAG: LytR family transcriptional regulator [Ruminococcaceae bacterium]|nr:LytR family transcriptional regulator [Oscillospiraceae bacterium]
MKKRQIAIWLPTIGALLLSLAVFAQLFLYDDAETQVTASGIDSYKTILLAGVDEAGENTDMLMLCTVDKENGSVRFLQIPRDTFYKTDKGIGKINRIYRSNLSKYGKKRAAEELTKEMENALSVSVDGYVVFDIQTVKSFVDTVGGVPVNVPHVISYFDGNAGVERTIPAGERILNGEEAVAFVRHRKSYAEGDLGRLDAQLRFLSGVATIAPSLKKIDCIVGIYQKILPNLLTNLTEKDIMEVMMAYLKNRNSYTVTFMRLPGEACYTNGTWYYVLYRGATEAMLKEQFGASVPFDNERRFTDTKRVALSNIYFTKDTIYRVYTPDEVANKRILRG